MPAETPIHFAYILEGPAKGLSSEAAVIDGLRSDEFAWVHLDGTHEEAAEWIFEHMEYLDPQAAEALTDVNTRPRVMAIDDGVMMILRGMNYNEGEDPEDMVSVRIYADEKRVVTISRKRVLAVERMAQRADRGAAPEEVGEFLVHLIEDLVGNIAAFQTRLDTEVADLEEMVIAQGDANLRRALVDKRLQLIAALRFLKPQRDALADSATLTLPFLSATVIREIEEEAVKMVRIVEDMEELRDQTAILREELSGQLSDRLNRNMFVMSMASVIFLPLGFMTGLFGVNVAGMPGVENPYAFYVFCAACAGIMAIQVALLIALRWLGTAK
ncbi:MAG: zinc transporter ZntB [Pseudomonadota bacterium]|nr:zinc transporter ZntB [Pseudomonadota bacterium]